ncbi:MAG: transglycosylase SLT domain-containing protein [Rhodocyclaceae bacterium]
MLAAIALPAAAQEPADIAAAGDAPVALATDGGDSVVAEVRDSLPRIATVDLVSEPADIWERLRNGFSMPELDSPLVTQQQAWYLSHPQTLARIIERSRRYLFHIVEEIEKRGLPTELALLPMVESAYDPMALSPARASGLWQFIPETGRNYRLRQNWWADERRDVVASTSAALEYLRDIYEMNGDWHLALASYNWGENAVARAVERNLSKGLPADYLSLPMPAETRNYVPKLQALKNIVAQPHLFGIRLDPIPNRPYFETVEKPADMDIALAARLAEVPLEEFRALNPAYNRPVASGPARLVLPADKVEVFLANLARYDKPLVTWQTYTLRKGDRLERVARHFGIALARLKQVNGIGARMKLGPGHSLLVPARDPLSAAEELSVNLPPERAAASARPSRLAKAGVKSSRAARIAPVRHAAKHAKRSAKPLARSARTRSVVALKAKALRGGARRS